MSLSQANVIQPHINSNKLTTQKTSARCKLRRLRKQRAHPAKANHGKNEEEAAENHFRSATLQLTQELTIFFKDRNSPSF